MYIPSTVTRSFPFRKVLVASVICNTELTMAFTWYGTRGITHNMHRFRQRAYFIDMCHIHKRDGHICISVAYWFCSGFGSPWFIYQGRTKNRYVRFNCKLTAPNGGSIFSGLFPSGNSDLKETILAITIYPYKIVTCHNRAYEVSKCTFALTTRSISAGQKSCIAVNTGFLTCYGLFMTSQLVTFLI